ncbi:hypothetical protein SAMN05444272_4390 [Roseibium suaedae]|uniref:Uncharacterized protein n=1 Tax=Roseibium suaedae TaxID=735517 RepID=A0A1M7PFH7_9HYPH|nr:hypothetical protein SAMN05444272_4390 [Roseibium suaedae]
MIRQRRIDLERGSVLQMFSFVRAGGIKALGAGLMTLVLALALSSGQSALAAGPKQSMADQLNDYPTEARADYVFGCMATNGQSSDVLRRCSCSIDVIASILPYEKYVEAATVLSMRQTGGERMAIFSQAASARELVANLRRAQAEADIVCF